jgi:hypothetical protein
MPGRNKLANAGSLQNYAQEKQFEDVDRALEIVHDILLYGQMQFETPKENYLVKLKSNNREFRPVKNADQLAFRAAQDLLKRINPEEGENAFLSNWGKKSYEEMVETILGDGTTPHINDVYGLKRYLAYGADFSNVDTENPEVKKNLPILDSDAMS